MAYVLAGGRGSRLMELTDRRAKPAVYFGGKSRIIDFALSNALNSGIRRIGVATQYKAALADPPSAARLELLPPRAQRDLRHPAREPARLRGPVVCRAPPTRSIRTSTSSTSIRSKYMVILAGDHVYKMDYEQMLAAARRAEAPMSPSAASRCRAWRRPASASCMSTTDDRIVAFVEKPKDPPGMPGKPDMALASMGIYVFDDEVPERRAASRRRRPEFEPRFRQGHHSPHRQARQGGRPSLPEVLRALLPGEASPIGATSAPSMPIGRPIST